MSDPTLPTDSAARKDVPLARGCLDYFPAALAEVARLSLVGNQKHNPGEELHWARGKSTDHRDCIVRHVADCGIVDTDGFLHDVKVAWRALANLQEALEKLGAPLARGARLAEVKINILPDLSCGDIPLERCITKFGGDDAAMCETCPAKGKWGGKPVPGLREVFYPEAQS